MSQLFIHPLQNPYIAYCNLMEATTRQVALDNKAQIMAEQEEEGKAAQNAPIDTDESKRNLIGLIGRVQVTTATSGAMVIAAAAFYHLGQIFLALNVGALAVISLAVVVLKNMPDIQRKAKEIAIASLPVLKREFNQENTHQQDKPEEAFSTVLGWMVDANQSLKPDND